jgi:hypothetical protein
MLLDCHFFRISDDLKENGLANGKKFELPTIPIVRRSFQGSSIFIRPGESLAANTLPRAALLKSPAIRKKWQREGPK